ncbi:MAG: response regulator [Deltaproteobacteria bacterium]|nr:response regulator [Deltaproteobacteria bacterium]
MGIHPAQRILIVDDDPVVRMLVTEYLSHYGHSVEVVESGKLCLEKLRENSPDILILDMLMPDMSGTEVLEQLRANPTTANLPVIMLSADKRMAADASSSAHADCYIQKPFDIKDFLRAIDDLHKPGKAA